jgi:hypothetical protein
LSFGFVFFSHKNAPLMRKKNRMRKTENSIGPGGETTARKPEFLV